MSYLFWKGQELEIKHDESVLDCLLRHNIDVPYGCKKGICHACKLKSVKGTPTAISQEGLRDAEKMQGHFLSCQCYTPENLEIDNLSEGVRSLDALVVSIVKLNAKVIRLRLKTLAPFSYRGGQYINLQRSDGLARSYSLASTPYLDGEILELHIALCQDGSMTNWMFQGGLNENDTLKIDGPIGNCFYTPTIKELLLIGIGTGLAPLYGLAREAIYRNHLSPIKIIIGNRQLEDLYYLSHLQDLEQKGVKLVQSPPENLIDTAIAHIEDPSHTRAYICGSKSMVTMGQRELYLSGIPLSEIYADAFFSWEHPESLAI